MAARPGAERSAGRRDRGGDGDGDRVRERGREGHMEFRDIAEAAAGPDAAVFEHGWQSWSPAGTYPAAGCSPRPANPAAHILGYRPELPAPEGGFQGEGLLALDAGDGAVRIWS